MDERSFYSIASDIEREEGPEAITSTPDTVEGLLSNALYGGHLLLFCEKQYCSENVKFALEVDKFNAEIKVEVESSASWKEKDEINSVNNCYINESTITLQSLDILKILNKNIDKLRPTSIKQQAIERILFLWNHYIGSEAISQICVPAKILGHIIKRLELLHIYGNDVFSECMIDPIKTIKRDILPRYLVSDIHVQAVARISDLNDYLSPLIVSAPDNNVIVDRILSTSVSPDELQTALRSVPIPELLIDRLIYQQFLKYLRDIIASENLLCLRMIEIYRDLLSAGDRKGAVDHAWLFLKYFVKFGSPYEVSVSSRRRREVFEKMANPDITIFDRVERSALQVLVGHYESYKSSSSFPALVDAVQHYNTTKNKKTSSCFG